MRFEPTDRPARKLPYTLDYPFKPPEAYAKSYAFPLGAVAYDTDLHSQVPTLFVFIHRPTGKFLLGTHSDRNELGPMLRTWANMAARGMGQRPKLRSLSDNPNDWSCRVMAEYPTRGAARTAMYRFICNAKVAGKGHLILNTHLVPSLAELSPERQAQAHSANVQRGLDQARDDRRLVIPASPAVGESRTWPEFLALSLAISKGKALGKASLPYPSVAQVNQVYEAWCQRTSGTLPTIDAPDPGRVEREKKRAQWRMYEDRRKTNKRS